MQTGCEAEIHAGKKREFTTQVALDYFDGSARKTEATMGWDRRSIQRGLNSLRTGVPYQDNYQVRGRKKIETILPSLPEDIQELVDRKIGTIGQEMLILEFPRACYWGLINLVQSQP